jgi:hypothetical protein
MCTDALGAVALVTSSTLLAQILRVKETVDEAGLAAWRKTAVVVCASIAVFALLATAGTGGSLYAVVATLPQAVALYVWCLQTTHRHPSRSLRGWDVFSVTASLVAASLAFVMDEETPAWFATVAAAAFGVQALLSPTAVSTIQAPNP